MDLNQKIVVVTGANRGIGKALVESLLKEPVAKIYAAARDTSSLPDFSDERVVALSLDIMDKKSVKEAALKAHDVDILFNNAGILNVSSVLKSPLDLIEKDMNTNFYGTLRVVQAFAPMMEKRGSGAIVNTISVVGLASMPMIGGYSASKAALFSATQAMRAELKSKNISVHAVFPGPIDTEMSAVVSVPKASPAVTADKIVKGVEEGLEDIFPDPASSGFALAWHKDPKKAEGMISRM